MFVDKGNLFHLALNVSRAIEKENLITIIERGYICRDFATSQLLWKVIYFAESISQKTKGL